MMQLQQGFAGGGMGFDRQFASQKSWVLISALGLGCSLISGVRWLCRLRVLRRYGHQLDNFRNTSLVVIIAGLSLNWGRPQNQKGAGPNGPAACCSADRAART
jgi:hypothetical protein